MVSKVPERFFKENNPRIKEQDRRKSAFASTEDQLSVRESKQIKRIRVRERSSPQCAHVCSPPSTAFSVCSAAAAAADADAVTVETQPTAGLLRNAVVTTSDVNKTFFVKTKTKTLPIPLNRLPYHGHKMNKTVYTRHA